MAIAAQDNVILVGPARSGSTLACSLLNKAKGVVALDEPFGRDALKKIKADGFIDFVAEQFDLQRAMIGRTGEALSTNGNMALVNHYARKRSSSGLRQRQVVFGKIQISPPTDPYTLVFKHTIPFTGAVKGLMSRFRAFALVRNPLAILASWNTIDAAYREGEIQPYAVSLTGTLAKRLRKYDDRLERQIALLEWHFEQYRPLLDHGAVVRYEDLIASDGRALGVIVNSARQIRTNLKSRNSNKMYDSTLTSKLATKLVETRGAIWDFYARASVEQLCSEIELAARTKKVSRNVDAGI